MKTISLALAALWALTGLPAAAQPPRAVAAFAEAVQAARANRPADAERLYKETLRLDPKSAVAWANLSLVQARTNRLKEALESLERACTLEPKNATFRAQRAAFALRAGRADDALADALRALALDPKSDDALSITASLLFTRRRYAEAVPVLRRLDAVRNGKDRQVAASLVSALVGMGKRVEARAAARTLAARFPKDANAHLMVGDLAGQLGFETKNKADLDEARRAYQKAFALAPNNLRAGINAAVAAEMAGQNPEAERILTRLIAAHPNEVDVRIALGRLYFDQKEYRRAQTQFEAVVGRDSKNPNALVPLATALMLQGPEGDTAAINYYKAALASNPQDGRALRGLAFVAERAKRTDDAIAAYRQLARTGDAASDEASRKIAALLAEAGRTAEAQTELRALAERRPKETAALRELGGLLLKDGRGDAAREAFERATLRDPKDAAAWVGLGQAQEKLGHDNAAQTAYGRAIDAAPGSAAAHNALITLLTRLQKTDVALAARERLVTALPDDNAARFDLAQAYIAANRDDDALRALRAIRLVKDDPRRLSYRLGPANLYRQRGRHAEEVAELERVLGEERAETTRTELRYGLVDALVRAGRPADAERLLATVEKAAPPGDPRPLLTRADLYERSDRLDDAAREYEELIARHPDTTRAYYGLRRVRERQESPEMAQAYLEKMALSGTSEPIAALMDALELFAAQDKTPERSLALVRRSVDVFPKSRTALVRAARTLLHDEPVTTERRTEAAELYRRLTVLAPTDEEIFTQYGRQLELLGKKDDAIRAYTEAVRLKPDSPAVGALRALGAPIPTAKTAPEKKAP
jgi:tetratricopeptide (TPR) repeat protein